MLMMMMEEEERAEQWQEGKMKDDEPVKKRGDAG